MPTYEYECHQCHHHFDAFQSMSSAVYTTCPKELCQMKKWGKGQVKRLIGAGAGLIFKGSGFYITDYRSEGYKKSEKSDTSSKEVKETKTTSSDQKSPAPSVEKTPSSTKSVTEKKSSSLAKDKQ